MRIGMVLGASAGGIGRHVASLVPRLVGRGHRVQIFCPPDTARAQDFDRLGVGVRTLSEVGRARSADVLHAHGYKAAALTATLDRPFGPPLVASWHNAVLAGGAAGFTGRSLQRYAARTADLTLGASEDLVELARSLGARARLSPVAAAALPAPSADRQTLRRRLGAGDGAIALSVGRLAAQKNYPMLCDVAASLAGRPIEFWVVGDGPERDELRRRVVAEKLPVRLLGDREDVADLLAVADLFVLTSHWEARALVAQEALQAGVPLVGTQVGGVPGLVGEAALLVPDGDVAAAAEAIMRVLEEPGLADRLRIAGRARARTWPDEDAVALDVELAYRSVLLQRG